MLVLTIFVVLRKRNSTLTTTPKLPQGLRIYSWFTPTAWKKTSCSTICKQWCVFFCVFILLLCCCFCVFAVAFFFKPFSGWIFLFVYWKKDDVWCLSWVTLRILFSSAPSFHSSILHRWTCFHVWAMKSSWYLQRRVSDGHALVCVAIVLKLATAIIKTNFLLLKINTAVPGPSHFCRPGPCPSALPSLF